MTGKESQNHEFILIQSTAVARCALAFVAGVAHELSAKLEVLTDDIKTHIVEGGPDE
jgi:hypothetical protein